MKETTRIAAIWILMFLAIVFAAAGRLFRTCPASPKSFCIANLVQIAGAKDTWMLEHEKTTNDVPTDSDLFGTNLYVKIKPQCGMGGVYTLGPLTERPKCSIPGHILW